MYTKPFIHYDYVYCNYVIVTSRRRHYFLLTKLDAIQRRIRNYTLHEMHLHIRTNILETYFVFALVKLSEERVAHR